MRIAAPIIQEQYICQWQCYSRLSSATNNDTRISKLSLRWANSNKTPPVIKSRKKKKTKNGGGESSSCSTSDILRLMDGLRIPAKADNAMYASLIDDCSSDSAAALDLQNHLTRRSRHDPLPFLHLLNRLILLHVTNGRLDNARQLFDEMPLKDFNSWATLIAAYSHNADYLEALKLFFTMLHRRHICGAMEEFPAWMLACLVDACAATMEMGLGKQLHGCCLKLGQADKDMILAASLINFYGKMRCHEDARRASHGLSQPNALTWTARMISDSRNDRFLDIMNDFKDVGRDGIGKNTCMFSCALRACARMHDGGFSGRQIHANAVKLGVELHSFVQCGLVDMYGRNGMLGEARMVFQTTSNDTTSDACWNAMLTSYLRNGLHIEAMKFLYQMKEDGLQPQDYLLDQVRVACASSTV